MRRFDVVIVGGGHAGAQAAIALRQYGFTGTLAIVTEEAELPYERPPLSKAYLLGTRSFDRMLIRPPVFWTERTVEIVTRTRVESVDAHAHLLTAADGTRIGYGRLIWAAGGKARRLSCAGHDLAGVHTLRTRADADALVDDLGVCRDAVVVGGGYIGLEVAAALVKLGKTVTLLEAQDRVLARVAGRTLARFVEAEHRRQGVDVRLGAKVERIEGEGGRAAWLYLGDGSRMRCDLVVVGIGIAPTVEPLLSAGARGADGVAVDAQCRTSLPDILAIGDCALHRNRFAGDTEIRLECVQNAHDQAVVAARSLLGQAVSYDAVPWFWSDQYDLKLQTVGLCVGHDEVVVRGEPDTRSFSLVYLQQGRVIALDCVNRLKDYAQGRRLVSEGTRPDRACLADAAVPLKDLVG